MKKNITLIMALMTLSLFGFAQRNIDMKLVNKALNPQQLRSTRNDIAPSRIMYNVVDGEVLLSYSQSYSYDQYEYFLTQIETQFQDLGVWYPSSLTTYEYDFNLMPIQILKQRMDGDWVNDEMNTITYNGDDFMPLIGEELFQSWENNQWVNVSKNIYTYEPELTILVRDWNGTTFENHYLYTITEEFDTKSILFQYWNGGAWQNQEKMDITYNDNQEIAMSITQEWVNQAWSNAEKVEYLYDAPYKLGKVTKTRWVNNEWASNKVKTIDYEYTWMGSKHAIVESNYGDWEEQNTDIELFYNEGESITLENVHEVEAEYIDVTNVNEHPATNAVVIAPNPATDRLEVSAEHFINAEVYTLTGQRVMESQSPIISLKGLASGTYFIKVYQENHAVNVQKFVVR